MQGFMLIHVSKRGPQIVSILLKFVLSPYIIVM